MSNDFEDSRFSTLDLKKRPTTSLRKNGRDFNSNYGVTPLKKPASDFFTMPTTEVSPTIS